MPLCVWELLPGRKCPHKSPLVQLAGLWTLLLSLCHSQAKSISIQNSDTAPLFQVLFCFLKVCFLHRVFICIGLICSPWGLAFPRILLSPLGRWCGLLERAIGRDSGDLNGGLEQVVPCSLSSCPSMKPPTLLLSCMTSLLPLKEWLLINAVTVPYLISPRTEPDLILRSYGRPCALEKSHPRTCRWEKNMRCCSRIKDIRTRC